MIAKFKPKNLDALSLKQRDCNGKEFNFKQVRPVDGQNRYWPDDILFPGTGSFPETDLEFEGETEVYCRKCSEISGICNPVFHLPPVCS